MERGPLKHLADYPHFQFVRGLAEYRQGHLDRAIATDAKPWVPHIRARPRLVLAMALHRSGRVEEARKMLAAAVVDHNWRDAEARDQDGWIHHVLRREAEGLILPDGAARLQGGVPAAG